MLILHSTYHRHPGGVHHAFLTYCDALADRGFECVAVLPTAPPPLHVLERHSIAVIAHPAIASRWGARNPFAAAALSSAVAGRRPVAVIMHNGRSLGLLRRACPGVPMLVVNHGGNPRKMVGADAVINVAAHLRDAVVAAGQPAKRCYILPNFIRVEDAATGAAATPPTVPTIGALGRLSAGKGLEIFIDALILLRKRVPCFRVIVGGDGEILTALRRRSAPLGADIEFCGWIADKPAFFARIDAFCLPSTKETFGITLLEAMAFQVPIVSTDCAGPREILPHRENALIAPRNDAAALAAAMATLLEDRDLQKRLVRSARETLRKKYEFDDNAGKLVDIINAVVGGY